MLLPDRLWHNVLLLIAVTSRDYGPPLGDIQMLRTAGNPELRDFNLAIRFPHRPTRFLVATVFVAALAVGLLLVSDPTATAQTGNGIKACTTGHRFEPGPIVDGRHRQPTQGEIEARTEVQWALRKTSAGS